MNSDYPPNGPSGPPQQPPWQPTPPVPWAPGGTPQQPPGPPYGSPPAPPGVPPQDPPAGWQPPGPPWQPPKPRRSWPARHKIWTAILAVVAVVIVLGVVGAVVGSKPIGQDTNAGNELAMFGVNGDGFKLAEAAGAALQNPSPVDTRDYKKAMANFGFMGVSLTNGNINDAGATGSSGCGDWNLPQSNNCG